MRSTDSWRFLGGGTDRTHSADISLTFPLHHRWSIQLPSSVFAQPVSDGEDIYVCSLTDCYRIDMQRGGIVWQLPAFEPPGEQINGFNASPAIYQNRVYVTDMMGRLYCIEKDTGALLWVDEKIGAYSVSVCIEQDHIFTKSRVRDSQQQWIKHFCCLDLDGNTRWTFEGNGVIRTSDGAIKQGILIIGGEDGLVYGVQIETGAMLWQFDLNQYADDFQLDRSRRIASYEHPLIAGNTAIVGVQGHGMLVGLDLFSGKLLWHHQVIDTRRKFRSAGGCLAANPAYLMYAMIEDFRVVDVQQGKLVYLHDTAKYDLGHMFSQWGLIAGRHYIVCYSTSQAIAAYDWETGELVWKFDAKAPFRSTGLLVDNQMVFADTLGHVYCFSSREDASIA